MHSPKTGSPTGLIDCVGRAGRLLLGNKAAEGHNQRLGEREISLKKKWSGMIENEGFWLSVTDFPTIVVKSAKGSDIAL